VEGAARSATGALGLVAGAVGIAAAGALAYGIDQASKYQDSLRQIEANAHLTADQTAALGTAIESTATGTTASANAMAAALGPIAGELERVTGGTLSAADASKTLTAAQDLAESSHIQLATALKSVTDTMLIYHQNTSQAAQDATDFFQAQAQLGIGADQLSRMLQRLQPRLAGSGTSIEQLLGIVREMEPTIGSGSRAIMYAGTILQRLQNPTVAAQKALSSLGVQVEDAKGKFLGFPAVLDKLKAVWDSLPPTVSATSKALSQATLGQMLFGMQANIGKVLIEGGAKGVIDNTKALQANGSAADAATLQMTTLSGILKVIKADFDTVATAIGGPGVAALQGILRPILDVVNGFTRFAVASPGVVTAVLAIAATLGSFAAVAKIVGPLLGGIGIDLGVLLGPVGLLMVAFAGLAIVVSRTPAVMQPLVDAFNVVSSSVGRVIGEVEALVGPLLGVVTGAVSVHAAIGDLASAFGLAANQTDSLADAVVGALGAVLDSVASAIPGIVDALGRVALAFVAWVGPMVPLLLDALTHAAALVIDWIEKQVPVWTSYLLLWAQTFIAWVQPLIPPLLAALGQLGSMIIDWIVNTLVPWAAGALATLIGAFVGWVGQVGPPLLAALGLVGLTLVGWIAKEATVVAGAMANLATKAIGRLAKTLVSDPGSVAKAIGDLFNAGAVAAVIIAAGLAAGALWAKMMQLGAKAAEAITGFANVIVDVLKAQLPEFGVAGGLAGGAYGTGMEEGAVGSEAITGLGAKIAAVLLPEAASGGVIAAAGAALGTAFSVAFVAVAVTYIGGRIFDFLNSIGRGIGIPMPPAGSILPGAGAPAAPPAAAWASGYSRSHQFGTTSAAAATSRTEDVMQRFGITPAALTAAHRVGQTLNDLVAAAEAHTASLKADTSAQDVHAAAVTRATAPVAAAPPSIADIIAKYAKQYQAGIAAATKGIAASTALPGTSATTSALSAQDALTKAQQQLALSQAAAAGKNTKIIASADAVANAQAALTLAHSKLKDAEARLTAVEDAHYKTAAQKAAALAKAHDGVIKAEDALQIATIHLATARQKAATTDAAQLKHAQDAVTKAETALSTAEAALAAAQAARIPNARTLARDEQKVGAAQTTLTAAQQALADLDKQLGISTSALNSATSAAATTTINVPMGTGTRFTAGGTAPGTLPPGSAVAGSVLAQASLATVASGAALVTGDAVVVAWQTQVVNLLTVIQTQITSAAASLTALAGRTASTAGAAVATVAAGRTPPGIAPAPTGRHPGVTIMPGAIVVTIDGRLVAATIAPDISKILMDEERTYAGPVNPLSGF
jgi:TP901 family phage tail tape measure protein